MPPGFPIDVERREAFRGFTLIEMLVVLFIIGLCVGLVSIITRPDERALLHVEAERLARLLDLAAVEARFSGKSIAWTADGRRYRFWRRLDAGWSEVLDNDLLRARELPPGMAVSAIWMENVRAPEDMRLEFVPYHSTMAYSIELALGTGRYTVAASPTGKVRVLAGEAKTDGYGLPQ